MKSLKAISAASVACTLALLATHERSAPVAAQDPSSGVVTLYTHDDLISSFDFETGRAGGRVESGEISLDRAQIVFDIFQSGSISFGFGGNQYSNVIDLGAQFVSPNERAQDGGRKLPASLFHTLFFDGRRVSFVGPGGKVHRHRDAARIFDPLPPEGMYHVPVEIGHTYLVRFRWHDARGDGQFAKFQIVDYEPGSRMTMRWAML